MSLLLRARIDRKATSGIIEWCRARVHIDHGACDFVVGSAYPGCATAAKGAGVHRLKSTVSWVQNAVKQFVLYLMEVLGV